MVIQRAGIEVKLYSPFNLGTRWWWVVNATPQLLESPLRIVQEKETSRRKVISVTCYILSPADGIVKNLAQLLTERYYVSVPSTSGGNSASSHRP